MAKINKDCNNLIPRVSHLTAPWSVLWGSKIRDPENKVGTAIYELEKNWANCDVAPLKKVMSLSFHT